MSRSYGAEPISLGIVDAKFGEFCYVQDMPIALPNKGVVLPELLTPATRLINLAMADLEDLVGNENFDANYIYLTVKHLPVRAGSYITRPGWHADSFGNDDMTYIWSNVVPTEFSIQPFILSQDCDLSLKQMEEQAVFVTTYPDKSLLRLDQFCIHRPGPVLEDCVRTFVKITFSKRIFALEGNSKNPLLPTDWVYQPRRKERNHPWGV